jgi:hypothetical protein
LKTFIAPHALVIETGTAEREGLAWSVFTGDRSQQVAIHHWLHLPARLGWNGGLLSMSSSML